MSGDLFTSKTHMAKHHFGLTHGRLDAASAIERAHQLCNEARTLKEAISWDKIQAFEPAFQFPSYFIVGFVTCLEWHARSRLHDLLRYDATNFTADDFKQASIGNNLDKIIKNQTTMAQFIAQSTMISDFNKYIRIFDRVLSYLKITKLAAEIAKAGSDKPDQVFPLFIKLFVRRHALVHEIGQDQIGHRNLRDPLSLEEAQTLGAAVIELMTKLELAITEAAPGNFPNIVQGPVYISQHERVLKMITDIEDKLIEDINNAEMVGLNVDNFIDSIKSSRAALNASALALRNLTYPGFRYYSISEPLLLVLYEKRLEYISLLSEEFYKGSVIIPRIQEA